jgi:hypothetical protein
MKSYLTSVAETSLPWFHCALLTNIGSRCALRVEWDTSENTAVCAGCFAGVIAPRINAFTNACNI